MNENVTRKCIVSGEVLPQDDLLRFVSVDGAIIPDFKKKLSGKGVYVSCSKSMLQTAVSKNLFAKATKGAARADDNLVALVEALLKKHCLEMINLTRKAGQFVTGFDKVKEALAKHKAAFVLEAIDAGNDGHQKIAAAAQELDVLTLFTVEELDKALDKVNTVHAVFLKGKMADSVYKELKHYKQFLDA